MEVGAHTNRSDEKSNLNNRRGEWFFLDENFRCLILGDEKEKFILEICRRPDEFAPHCHIILQEVILAKSVKCAEALITGQTPLVVDLNFPCHAGMCPLHYVAYVRCEPCMVELLLYYGARPDIRLTPTALAEECRNMLPLQIAVLKTM